MKRELEPRQVKPINAEEAWLYVNDKSIEVFIRENNKSALACRITKKQLEDILGV